MVRVYTNGILTVRVGEVITGSTSNCSGPLAKVLDRNNNELTAASNGDISLTNEQVYTFVFSNHNGKTFKSNETLIIPILTTYNNANNTALSVTIAKDAGKVSKLNVSSTGGSYESAVLSFEGRKLQVGSIDIGK